MGEVKWTDEQSLAIKEKGQNILVAAAARSGKTAVLVERIINKIIKQAAKLPALLYYLRIYFSGQFQGI